MKLKQQKYSQHGDKDSCDNIEATFPSKSGHGHAIAICQELLCLVLPTQRLLVHFLMLSPVLELVPKFIEPPQREGTQKKVITPGVMADQVVNTAIQLLSDRRPLTDYTQDSP